MECYSDKKILGAAISLQEGATVIGGKLAAEKKNPIYFQCSRCGQSEENIGHILTNCKGRRKDYIDRHDEIGKQVYKAIGKKYGLFKYYQKEPVTIKVPNEIEIHWNKRVTKGNNSQPDITIYDYKREEVILLDISVVNKKYLDTRFKEKNDKYNATALELKQMKNFKYCKVIPIIVSNEGLIHRKTVEILDQVKIKINWGKAISKLLFINVQLIQRIYTESAKWRLEKSKQLRRQKGVAGREGE